MGPTKVVVGHSFGGRLALEYVAAAGASGEPLEALWLLDTVPGQAHESVDQVLAAVTDIVGKNRPIERNELVQVLTETYGMDKGVAQWLGSSYNAKTGDFGFDLRLVRDLKPEFANQDFVGLLRSILETNSTEAATVVHLVRGGKNGAWSVPVLAELEALAKEFPQTFHMYVLPTAGHWVHVDDLPGLVHLFDKHS
jgi:pimeloyl-ACP methyl ester carboxylesterase